MCVYLRNVLECVISTILFQMVLRIFCHDVYQCKKSSIVFYSKKSCKHYETEVHNNERNT